MNTKKESYQVERQVFVIRDFKVMTTMVTKSEHGPGKSRSLKHNVHSVTEHF